MNTSIMRWIEPVLYALSQLLCATASLAYLRFRSGAELTGKKLRAAVAVVCAGAAAGLAVQLLLSLRAGLPPAECLPYGLLISASFLVTLTDLSERRIPDAAVIAVLAGAVILTSAEMILGGGRPLRCLAMRLLGAAVGGGVPFAASALSKGGIGGGDIKYLGATGLFLGLGDMLTVMTATMLLASAAGIAMIVFKKAGLRDEMPLAPFICAGILLCLVSRALPI